MNGMALALSLAMIGICSATALAAPGGIVVGSKSYSESVTLGEIAADLATRANIPASRKAGLGGTQVVWEALLRGDVDLYPEYTGTLLQEQLQGQGLPSPPSVADLRTALARQGIGMTDPLGFNNSYAIGMRRERAAALGITTISDLRRFPALKYGFSQEFMTRSEGWPALVKRYDLIAAGGPSPDVRSMEHELAYRAIDSGSIDVVDLFSTDAELKLYDLVTLRDDRQLFPTYLAVYVYRLDTAQRFPSLVPALSLVAGRIDDAHMVALNSLTKVEKRPEADVARDFVATLLADPARRPAAAISRFQKLWGTFSAFLSERLWHDTRNHLLLVLVPLLLDILVGVPLGVLAVLRPRLGEVLLGVAGVIQTIPSLALLVFMIPVLGIGYPPAFVALFLYGLLPILRNTATGLTDVPPGLLESARALGLPRWHLLWKVELPLASRHVFNGIKIAAVINVGTATLGAIIGAGGYGEPIMIGIRRVDIALILEGAIPAALMAVLIQAGFAYAERVFVPKGLRLAAAGNSQPQPVDLPGEATPALA